MKLHVGSGPHYIHGMFNIDLREDCRTDYCGNLFDLTYADHPQHIAPGSVDFIWSCHALEHLAYPVDVVRCLKAFHDWLRADGVLRLAVPDLRLVASYYVNKDPMLMTMYSGTVDDQLYKKDSPAEMFTFFMRAWEHTVMFDFDLLHSLLSDAGFRNIAQMPFNQSSTGMWYYDRFPEESMYVEGTK